MGRNKYEKLLLGLVIGLASSSRATAIVADRQTSQSAFNWRDAGIGASVSVAAVLVLLTAFALGRRYRSRINRLGLADPKEVLSSR